MNETLTLPLELSTTDKSSGRSKGWSGVRLDVAAHAVLGLVGDSGARTSALVRVIAGIHPIDPAPSARGRR